MFLILESSFVFPSSGRGEQASRSDDLLLYFQDDVLLEDHWRVDGTHYERTANHWLANVDARKEAIMPVLERTCGKKDAAIWFQR